MGKFVVVLSFLKDFSHQVLIALYLNVSLLQCNSAFMCHFNLQCIYFRVRVWVCFIVIWMSLKYTNFISFFIENWAR